MRAMCRRVMAVWLAIGVSGFVNLASAQPTAPGEADLWKAMLTRLDAGALVAVRFKDGTRVKGTVLDIGDETFTLKPRTRIPIAARPVAFADVATIERQKPSMSPGKKVLLGVGIGAAVYVVSVALLLAAIGYD